MFRRRILLYIILGGALMIINSLSTTVIGKNVSDKVSAINRQLGHGINLGNMLEAPNEGDWGVRLEEPYFKLIHDAGFDSVRIPIRWSAHADTTAPYQIDTTFMNRVDWAVHQALLNHLAVVINFHNYDGMYANPEQELPRFLELWKQVAEHFKNQPSSVVFEILNEPANKLDVKEWNKVIPQVLHVIRDSNSNRVVMVGPAYYNSIGGLSELQLPEDDQRLIVTIHYYSPMHFTHQNAGWIKGSDKWAGTTWSGTTSEKQAVINDFDTAQKWAKEHNRPVYLGEFGAYNAADMDSRARWTHFVVEQAQNCRWSTGYWEFCSGFGAYDPEKKEWRKPLLKALLGFK